jgi:restriction system protein
MALPNQRTFLPALARLLAERGPTSASAAIDEVAERCALTEEQRSVMSESKEWEPKYRNIVRWARQDLNFAGLLDRDQPRGIWALNPKGLGLVSEHANDNDALLRAVYALQPRSTDDVSETEPTGASNRPEPIETTDEPSPVAPDEAVLDALATYERYIKEALRQELLEVTPTRFEHIVADVLSSSLRATRKEVTPPSRDGGIDGALWMDHLALAKVVFQAKRYDAGKVAREKIDAFYAAARRENAASMVFVTTSSYTREAIDAARAFGIRLIDGAELVDLMLRVGVGVKERRRMSLFAVDEGYFSEDQ